MNRFRPSRFLRRRSHGSRSDSGSGSEDESGSTIPNVEVFLDYHLPPEYFKQDVVRLIHGLRISGWSAVTMEMAEDIELDRISGAMTNAVFAVKPPSYIKEAIKREYDGRPYHHRLPVNLLLRVYGPQVDLVIDRESELATVAVLTKHNIGPKLLGTFINGRFEQFLNAKPLTRQDLRNPEISTLIAKRMRDLHDNVPVSPQQHVAGPLVWQKLRDWEATAVARAAELEQREPGIVHKFLGTDIHTFFAAVKKYQAYLAEKYPATNEELVFAHNDTQYGNILRLEPPKGSPLLRPQNEHRQLVVIDFEYSGPNPRAYDIVNHFCEWMYDYHDPTMSYHLHRDWYPSEQEQQVFVNSYVEHGSAVFDDSVMEKEAAALLEQARDWRAAASAHWAIWGLIQAPVDAAKDVQLREEMLRRTGSYEILSGSPANVPGHLVPEEEDEFNHQGYSKDKADLFWHDLAELGVSV